jgi:1-acyl-sn-glycerol-3-phosphate acyltransferase
MHPIYSAICPPARWFLQAVSSLEVHGVEHIPPSGPFLLLPNHQSALDPFLVQSFCPRPVHSMTKSTQFASAPHRWLLSRVGAFPVRRYQVDPQAVRTALRLLDAGEGVCIYPEGERSWDGAIQPFRRGALRLALRAGVPLIPVGIHGMFDVWPRWLSRPRPGARAHLRFGEPFSYGVIRDRQRREALLPELESRLVFALEELAKVPLSETARRRLDGIPESESASPLS